MAKLTPKQQRFVDEYLIDLNATQSAIRAGYSPKSAGRFAQELLIKTHIAQAIEQAKAERSERTKITQDDVLKMWHDLATVDYNEISQLLNVNCRYCWGIDHEYQYTPKEWQRVCESADKEQASRPPFGGDDFNHKRAPNPNCPEYGGLGNATIHLHDTDRLSPQAKLAYQGAKAGKFGIEVLTTDRMKALDNIARHLGMFNDKLQMEQLGEQSVNIKISYE
jgi:phage terminase small subunit